MPYNRDIGWLIRLNITSETFWIIQIDSSILMQSWYMDWILLMHILGWCECYSSWQMDELISPKCRNIFWFKKNEFEQIQYWNEGYRDKTLIDVRFEGVSVVLLLLDAWVGGCFQHWGCSRKGSAKEWSRPQRCVCGQQGMGGKHGTRRMCTVCQGQPQNVSWLAMYMN